MNKDNSGSEISLREERRRTGRYIAVALAICITLLALYQAVLQDTPVVAGLFVPAIIMFLYVFWVLHTASKTPKYHLPPEEDVHEEEMKKVCTCEINRETMDEQQDFLTEVIVGPSTSDKTPILPREVNIFKKDNIQEEKYSRNKLNRTYSIA